MKNQTLGIIGATSMVGQCLIQHGIAQNHHITAFSRQLINQNHPNVNWQQLPALSIKSTNHKNETIPYWIYTAPIWTLPDYFDFLLSFKLRRIVVLSSTSRFTKQNSSDLNEQVIAQKLIEGEKSLAFWANSHFLGWRRDRAALFQAADICVFPSRFEPFGNVVVQAWAQKIPLICSKSQGPLQFVRDAEDAFMFVVDNVDQLASKIKELISDTGLCHRLVEAGYARYKNEFTRQKIVSDYISFYEDILGREGLPI